MNDHGLTRDVLYELNNTMKILMNKTIHHYIFRMKDLLHKKMKCVLATLLIIKVWMASAWAVDQRPDVLFVLLDDLRHDALSFLDHPYVKTPNIDRLRERGAHMKNAFVSTSICCPSRASFLTGAYANRHGVIDNDTSEINPSVTPPINQVLKGAGYSTAMIGKWHMGHYGHRRPDWDYWLSFNGQGKYVDPTFTIGDKKVNHKGYTTDLLTDKAIDFIEQHPKDKPYFVMLSHKAVHGPFQPAKRHKDAYGKGLTAIETKSWSTDLKHKPKWQIRDQVSPVKWDYRTRDIEGHALPDKIPLKPWPKTTKHVDQFRCLAAVDEGLGRIFEMLEKRGTLNKTLIVFTSDNGYFHMEHRRWDKRLAMEETMRIPMIWAYPGHIEAGSTVEEMVMNIDFLPTVLDYVGIEAPKSVQGKSMRTCFEDSRPAWRDQVFYEYWTDLVHSIPTMTALRTERHKLIQYPSIDDLDELYDLESDPEEMNNLAVSPEYAELHQKLIVRLDEQKKDAGWKEYVFPNNIPKVKGKEGELWSLTVHQGKMVSEPKEISCQLRGVEVKRDALSFDGKSHLQLGKQNRLDPSQWPMSIELECKAEEDGVIINQSGEGYGYCIFIEDGRPGVSTKCRGVSFTTLDAKKSICGKWAKIKVLIHYNRLKFLVDDELVEDIYLPLPFKDKTNADVLVGEAAKMPVLERLPSSSFVGDIRSIVMSR